MSKEKRIKRDELKELQSIRNLLILYLRTNGCSSEDIGKAIDMEAGSVRDMVPLSPKKGKTNE